MKWFRRKPRITEEHYGNLMTAFGRAVDRDALVSGPARALAERVTGEHDRVTARIDAKLYEGAAEYHLRLLAGSWIMARDGAVPEETAEIFEEALVWKLSPIEDDAAVLPRRITELARGEFERDLRRDDER